MYEKPYSGRLILTLSISQLGSGVLSDEPPSAALCTTMSYARARQCCDLLLAYLHSFRSRLIVLRFGIHTSVLSLGHSQVKALGTTCIPAPTLSASVQSPTLVRWVKFLQQPFPPLIILKFDYFVSCIRSNCFMGLLILFTFDFNLSIIISQLWEKTL